MAEDQGGLVDVSSRLRIVSVFTLWWEELERVLYTDIDRATLCIHCLARIIDDCFAVEEEAWEVKAQTNQPQEEEFPLINRLIGVVMNDFADIADAAFQFLSSVSHGGYLKAMLRLMVSVKQGCWKTGDDFHIPFPQDGMTHFLEEQAAQPTLGTDSTVQCRLAFLAGELIEESNGELPFAPLPIIQLSITQFLEAKAAIQGRMEELVNTVHSQRLRASYIKSSDQPLPLPENTDATVLAEFVVDFEDVAGSIEHYMVQGAGNLRFLSATADCVEALQPSIEANMIEACLELLHYPNFPLQLFALGWFVTALIHKKVAWELVESNGLDMIMDLTISVEKNVPLYSLISPYSSFVLVALSKHAQPMEALVKNYAVAEKLMSFATQLFRAEKQMDPKLNVVEWFGEAFGHPLLLLAAQKIGVVPLIAWQLKLVLTSEVEDAKQGSIKVTFIKEAVRTLLKYVNTNLYWAVQHNKGSVLDAGRHHTSSNGIEVASCNIVKIDDKESTKLERYALKHTAIHNQLLPGMRLDLMNRFRDKDAPQMSPAAQEETKDEFSIPVEDFYVSLLPFFPRKQEDDAQSVVSQLRLMHAEWSVARVFIDYDLIPILLSVVDSEAKDTSVHVHCLQILQLLCLDCASILEIQHCQPHTVVQSRQPDDPVDNEMKKGIEILLSLLSPHVRRDPTVITGTLRVLVAMCTPPHYQACGSSVAENEKFLLEVGKKQTDQAGTNVGIASTKKRAHESAKKGGLIREAAASKIDAAQGGARTSVRAYSGISWLVQLVNFKRNQLFASQVRLETVKVLIGIAHDKEICQILSKMRVESIITDQLRMEEHQTAWDNAHKEGNPERAALVFFSNVLSEAVASNANVSDRILDATQEALNRKRVVEKSHIEFDEEELMDLIKDHLASKGLTSTVTVLQEELAGRKVPLILETVPSPALHGVPVAPPTSAVVMQATPFVSPSGATATTKKRPRSATPDVTEDLQAVETTRKLQRRLSHELPPMPAEIIPMSRQNSFQSVAAAATAPQSTLVGPSTVQIPLSHYQRGTNIARARKEASYGGLGTGPKAVTQSVASVLMSPEPSSRLSHLSATRTRPDFTITKTSSKLSSIMHRYLKLQHSQCKHPVATLPTLSLQKPHFCSRPHYHNHHRSNLYNIISPIYSLSNTMWYNSYRRQDAQALLRYMYSSYRSVRVVRFIDQELPVTACSFAHDPLKVLLGYNSAWNGPGPGITMLNYLTGMQESVTPLDFYDMDGNISRITLSPQTASTPSILLSVANEGTFRGGEHKLFLWKDLGTIQTFEARCQHQFKLQVPSSDTSNNEPYDVSLFWDEAFSSSGHNLAVAYSMDEHYADRVDPFSVSIFDLQTGACTTTLSDLGPQTVYEMPRLKFLSNSDDLLVFDGKLWDLRVPRMVHRFDKLSSQGCTAVHPFKSEVIIDNSVWDLRYHNLLQTVPLLDGFNVEFSAKHEVMFAYRVESPFQRFDQNLEYNFYHVLDSKQYQHIHTEWVEKENMVLWDLQEDKSGLGYMYAFSGTPEDSVCRLLEVGKRRVQDGSDDEEDEDDVDDEDDGEWMGQQREGGFNSDEEDDDDEGGEDGDEDDGTYIDEDTAITEDSDLDDDEHYSGEEDEEDEDEEYSESEYHRMLQAVENEAAGVEGGAGDDGDEEGWETVSEDGSSSL